MVRLATQRLSSQRSKPVQAKNRRMDILTRLKDDGDMCNKVGSQKWSHSGT